MARTKADEPDKGGEDAGQAQVQQIVDKENAQGFRGVEVDDTPNENYTVAGQAAGKPTPETEPREAADKDEG